MTFNPDARKPCPSTGELKECFDYKDGFLIYKKTGTTLGVQRKDGYYQASYKNVQYCLHRLIWIWHGNILLPNLVIDHIDKDPSNNRIENLRQVSQSINTKNSDRYKNPKYVYYDSHNKTWKVRGPRIEGKRKFLGNFKTEEEAIAKIQDYLN